MSLMIEEVAGDSFHASESRNLEFRIPAAFILLLAAILKIHQLATSPATANLIFESRQLSLALISAEILLAFWILSRWQAKLARAVALTVFSVFGLITFRMALNSEASCGCFGVFTVPPAATFLLDALIVGCLCIYRPQESLPFPKPMFAIALLLAVGGALIPFNLKTQSLDEIGDTLEQGRVVVLDVPRWSGKRLPVFEFLAPAEDSILEGEWRAIFYHEDCPKCQRLIQDTNAKSERTVFIEVPPYESPARENFENVKWTKLSSEYEWFVDAPKIVRLKDGVVLND